MSALISVLLKMWAVNTLAFKSKHMFFISCVRVVRHNLSLSIELSTWGNPYTGISRFCMPSDHIRKVSQDGDICSSLLNAKHLGKFQVEILGLYVFVLTDTRWWTGVLAGELFHTGSCLLTFQSSWVSCQLPSSVGDTQKPELLTSEKVQLSSSAK